jgi:OOP family OmpA-OmpF porin
MAIAMAGCSKSEPTAKAAASPASSAPAVTSQATVRAVCTMLTAAEMSTILGTTVGSERDEGGGSATCRYKPAERSMPHVEVAIDWGGGNAAMVAMRMMGRLEPGMANPLAGLGDEATAIGPAFMVRTGEDLVRLTLTGVDGDDVAIAKQIVSKIRPQMGDSATAQANAATSGGGSSDSSATTAARAGQLVEGLLSQLTKENRATSRDHGASSSGAGGSDTAHATRPKSARPDAPAFTAATGPSIRIPLVAGFMLAGTQHEPGRGDYEPMITVTSANDDKVSTVFSASLPEGVRLVVERVIRRQDLKEAREHRPTHFQGDPPEFPGSLAFQVSTAVYTELKTTGKAALTLVKDDANFLTVLTRQFSGGSNADGQRLSATLERVEPYALAFPILLNDEPAELHVIHARGRFDNMTVDIYVLDDAENPLILRISGEATGHVARIVYPTPAAAPLEEKLKKHARVELHGIYFDFGKATIRPESEPVLREIASALTHNPEWKIGIEGHTDNIGGDPYNLDLSRRRADAVKQALVDRYRVSATILTTAGFGASRPNASNDTLSGRARNRRVELVRQ